MRRRKVYLRPGYTDMRKSIHGLSYLVQDVMKLNLFEPAYFLFCGKRRDTIKILYWDKNGMCLWTKKLSGDKFPWTNEDKVYTELELKKIFWLLRGINFFSEHKEKYIEKY